MLGIIYKFVYPQAYKFKKRKPITVSIKGNENNIFHNALAIRNFSFDCFLFFVSSAGSQYRKENDLGLGQSIDCVFITDK